MSCVEKCLDLHNTKDLSGFLKDLLEAMRKLGEEALVYPVLAEFVVDALIHVT